MIIVTPVMLFSTSLEFKVLMKEDEYENKPNAMASRNFVFSAGTGYNRLRQDILPTFTTYAHILGSLYSPGTGER